MAKLTAKERNMIARGTAPDEEKVESKAKIGSMLALILIFVLMVLLAYLGFYLLGAQNTKVPPPAPEGIEVSL